MNAGALLFLLNQFDYVPFTNLEVEERDGCVLNHVGVDTMEENGQQAITLTFEERRLAEKVYTYADLIACLEEIALNKIGVPEPTSTFDVYLWYPTDERELVVSVGLQDDKIILRDR